eukprot:Phypoly_transcript_26130.p1 GENE.Phypoly_transcript_26130~~Phypoly_transcript_26130.p1  ORF type:complete len:127 (+),score=11.77 Phypoly_transcript_26130:84-464(+)
MAPAREDVYPGQSEGKSHAHSRNTKVGQGMQTSVDSKATSDPYENASSSAHNVAGNTAGNPSFSGNTATHGALQKSFPARSLLVPAGAGILGFSISSLALNSLPPTSRLAAATGIGALSAYFASRM